MARREGEGASSRPILLVGAGRKPKELGACLAAVGAVRAQLEGGRVVEPHRPQGLGDLEDLLSQRPSEGTLILDYERVPAEDIGFVRRFLERHQEWRLVLVGDDAGDRRARTLLALPRARWLAWPPDLDQLAALLEAPGSASAAPERSTERARSQPPVERRRRPAAPSSPPHDSLDVGNLLEELLASASLVTEGAPRYLFRCDETLVLKRDGTVLAEGLSGLLLFARRCAGEDGVVSAQADLSSRPGDPADTVRIRIDFPPGPLDEKQLEGLFETPLQGAPDLAKDAQRARNGVGDLRKSGARVETSAPKPDRFRFELHIASTPLSAPAPVKGSRPRRRAAGQARGTKAEDPFA